MTGNVIGGGTASYVYNGDGLRLSRTIGGQTASNVWDVASSYPLLLRDGTNTYVWGLGLVSMTDNAGVKTYPLVDGLGSTANVIDTAGNVVGSYTYDAFGAVRTHSGASTEFSFTGEQNDPNGLEYLRARYYDPATGRFLGQDPADADYNAPGTLNRFVYVLNNPANLLDPTGLCLFGISCKDALKIAACVTPGFQSICVAEATGLDDEARSVGLWAVDGFVDYPLWWLTLGLGVAGVTQVQIQLSECDAATKAYLTGVNLGNGAIGVINAGNPVPDPFITAAEAVLYVDVTAILSQCR